MKKLSHRPPGEKENRADRQARVMQMRVQGSGYQDIADALDCSLGTVHNDIQRALRERAAQTADLTDHLREMEGAYLDGLWQAIAPAAMSGHLLAIDRALKIRESYRKLMGLDAPAKSEHSGTVTIQVGDLTDGELDALARGEALPRLAAVGGDATGSAPVRLLAAGDDAG